MIFGQEGGHSWQCPEYNFDHYRGIQSVQWIIRVGLILRTISYWCFTYKNNILEIIIVLFILMSELRGQYSHQAAQESFENRTQRIQKSLKDLAEQAAEAKNQQQLSYFKGRYEEAERQNNALKKKVQAFQRDSQELGRIQQRYKEFQQKQLQIKNREAVINDQLSRQSKHEQILKLQLKLRQDFHNQNLQNKHKVEIRNLDSELRKAQYQLSVKKSQLQKTNHQKINLEQKLKSLQEEMRDTQGKLGNLQKSHKQQASYWQQKIKKIEEGYALRAKQLKQAQQMSVSAQINQRQWKIKDLQATSQSQKQSFGKKMQQLQKKVQQVDRINIQLSNQLELLRQRQNAAQQKNRELLKLREQSQNKFSKDLQNEKNILQAHFQAEICGYYDSTRQQISTRVEAIKKQQGKLIVQKQLQHALQIQKLKEQLQQQRQQSSKQLSSCKAQIDAIRRKQTNLRQQQQRVSKQSISQLQTIIANLSNIVLERSFKTVDPTTILQAVKEKISLSKDQISELKSQKTNLMGVNKTLELHSRQIRQWFRNISALLNSSDAAGVLEKGQMYDIGDGDVSQSILSFTKKLQNRLSKHKIQEEAQVEQIAKLSQQIRKMKMAKEGVDNTVTNLTDKVQFLEGQVRKASLERQSAQKSIKQYTSSITRLEDEIRQSKSSMAQKQASVISLKEQINTLQNVRIVGYANRIHQQSAKNGQLVAKLKKSEGIIANLQEQKRALTQRLFDRKSENEERLGKLQEMKRQMIDKQRQWGFQRESELARFRRVINQLFDNPEIDNTFDAMLDYIKSHKSGSEAGPFVVSTIFEAAPKERGVLEGIVCKFMQRKSIKTTFLYKYDEFNKNLANYLPIKSSYDFVLLAKTKKSQIFGVISLGLGPKSRALAFNVNSGKTFPGDPSMSSTTYDGSYLLFGQSEIRIRNNSILQLVVTTRIFNTRYFSFLKEELVGVENGDSVLLDALEIHRIHY